MKYASAMKYGGELVDAVDCVYDSFKELIPLCPNCKEPVFLRTGGQRESVKGKAYQIGPHWCHFKGISKEQVAGCELRVNGYTEQDRAKIASQARGQRLKLLQRWFWEVFSHSRQGHNSTMQAKIQRAREYSQHTDMLNRSHALVDFCRWGFYYICKNNLNSWIDGFVEESKQLIFDENPNFIANCLIDPSEYSSCVESTRQMFTDAYSIAGLELHKAQVKEVMLFLASRSAQNTLQECLAIYSFSILAIAGGNQDSEIWRIVSEVLRGTRDLSPGDGTYLLRYFIEWLWFIPWASEFQRLEAEAKQRKGAA